MVMKKCRMSRIDCESKCIFPAAKEDFICAGKTRNPTKFEQDTVKLCMKGKYVGGGTIEMTHEEALLFVTAILNVISDEHWQVTTKS